MTQSAIKDSRGAIPPLRSVRRSRERAKQRRGKAVLGVGLTIVAALWITPLFGLLVTSFRPTSDALGSGWWTALANPFASGWTLDNYSNALTGATSGTGFSLASEFLNSLAVAVPSTILPLMAAAFAAYAFTFFQFRLKEVYFAIIVGLLIVPQQIALIPILTIFKAFTKATGIQVTGTFAAAYMIHAAYALPLCIFILRNFMSTLPVSLIEAARVDGASHFGIFWRLVLPLSTAALASFAIFQFLWTWNDYLIAYIFIGSAQPVLQQGLLGLLGRYNQGWNLVAAGSFLVLIIPVTVFLLLQQYFVRGLTAGAVK